jgi:hypothetical protein
LQNLINSVATTFGQLIQIHKAKPITVCAHHVAICNTYHGHTGYTHDAAAFAQNYMLVAL